MLAKVIKMPYNISSCMVCVCVCSYCVCMLIAYYCWPSLADIVETLSFLDMIAPYTSPKDTSQPSEPTRSFNMTKDNAYT